MKQRDVEIGKTYVVKVSGRLARVRLTEEALYRVGLSGSRRAGWIGVNLGTGRTVRVRSAARLRHEAANNV